VQSGLDDVMQRLAARRHGEAGFVERHYLSLLKKPVESRGKLLYDAPDRLEKITLEPRPESLLLEGDLLTISRDHRSQTRALRSVPQALPMVESIRATLAGDRAALERLFRLEFSGDEAHWTLLLIPRETALSDVVSAIRIEGTGSDLFQVEIRQPDGDRSLMTLTGPGGQ